MEEELEQEEEQVENQKLFKPSKKGFFTLLLESFKFFTLNLPAIATIVVPVFLIVEYLVPLLSTFVDDLANELTGWKFIDNFLSGVIEYITIEFIRQLIGGIAWIAVIRVIAGAMHGEKAPGFSCQLNNFSTGTSSFSVDVKLCLVSVFDIIGPKI